MLSDAIREIQAASALDADKRRRGVARRDLRRRLDSWIQAVEDLVEHDSPTVPPTLLRDITAFMGAFDACLYGMLVRHPEPLRVLDVLFDAQEQLAHPDVPLEVNA